MAEYNKSQMEIERALEITDKAQGYDLFSTRIAAGNAPDIVGPMGIRGRSPSSASAGAKCHADAVLRADDGELVNLTSVNDLDGERRVYDHDFSR